MSQFETCQWLLYPELYKLVKLPRDEMEARPHVELQQFVATLYNPDAITIICTEVADVKGAEVLSSGWRVLQIKGPYEEENIKLVREIARILRDARIEIHHPTAFDTDYLLIKQVQIPQALDVLEQAEYRIDQRQSVSG
jgi:hypothetical protein